MQRFLLTMMLLGQDVVVGEEKRRLDGNQQPTHSGPFGSKLEEITKLWTSSDVEEISKLSKMGTLEKKKIFFEEADRPPPSYYDGSLEKMPLKKVPFQTPDPEKWLKAPEFVPRTKMLVDAFAPPPDLHQDISSLTEVPFVPIGHLPQSSQLAKWPFIPSSPAPFVHPAPPFPPMVPMPPAATPGTPALPVIPNGYTVNITNLNQGAGPPIPAIVLRKKRRKRNKNTQSLVMNSSESPTSSHPLDPNGYGSDRNAASTPDEAPIMENEESTVTDAKQLLSGSCPDLSEEQLEMWDNYLYAAAVDSKEKTSKPSPPPKSSKQESMEASAYDVLPRSLRDVAEQQLDGFSNPEIRRLDREINGNNMSSSMVMKRLAEQRYHDSDGSTQRSLAAEMQELRFRPEISKIVVGALTSPPLPHHSQEMEVIITFQLGVEI
ncbi:hypothetical protein RB195_001337 [Necator americanus]|uniref:Uncharacterized protein n=1 Tax=Necator americanus TaxID=51031 RepID=A0ABR1DGT3_NECAM